MNTMEEIKDDTNNRVQGHAKVRCTVLNENSMITSIGE